MNVHDAGFGPLDGLTVVEVGSMIAGPTAGRLLADYGATVIKAEPPGRGDHLRRFGPKHDGVSLWWKFLGRNKRSVTLDLRTPAGQAVFRDLAAVADVVVENFRPGTLERWGVGPETLHEVNPDLVVLRLSGFGQAGPYAGRPGFGTVAEAMSGFAHNNGFPDRPPVLPPTGLADGIAGVFGTVATMFALYHRETAGGGGQVIDTSLIEPIFSLLGPQAMQYGLLGEVPSRSGNQSTSSAPRNVYETADGRYVALSASAQPLAMRTLEAIERPELKEDPRFADPESRLAHRDELDAIIQDWMADHTRDAVLDRFEACEAALGPVYDIADVLADEHYRQRGVTTRIEDEALGDVAVQDVVARLDETPGRVEHLGPALGEHNDEVYGELLAYDDERLAALDRRGVI